MEQKVKKLRQQAEQYRSTTGPLKGIFRSDKILLQENH